MAAILESRGVHKMFGAVIGAANVNLTVGEGEVVGIIGANGAGKTTFVNIVTGYLKPDAGHILFMGEDTTGRSPREITRLGVRRSFQIPQLFLDLEVVDNVLVALAIAHRGELKSWQPVRTHARVQAAVDVLKLYGLEAHRSQITGTLPQGVRKLLDIAMATVGDARLVLLDEPTSGISVDEKFAVMDRLMTALKDRGVTILFIEHDMEIVDRYAQRVVAFYEGRIIADGPPDEVLSAADVQRFVVGTEPRRREKAGERAPC